MIVFDPKKQVLTAFREEAAASTDPMDRWGVVNRAWKRIDDYMKEVQSKNVIQEYKLFWDGMDTFKIEYVDSGDQKFVIEVNLGEKECTSE
jgi:hypothetical protein